MKIAVKFSSRAAMVPVTIILLCSFFSPIQNNKPSYHFPYKQAGLTERQAAAHMLSRLTYGSSPGQVESVINTGLENWFQQQLNAKMPDDSLDRLLSKYEILRLSNEEIVNTYPRAGQVKRRAINDGVIEKDSLSKADRKKYKGQLAAYMQQKGLKSTRELIREFISQKIVRAAYSNNQLQEVLTEFWFNHFNVSFAKNNCAQFIPAYERDVIRPNALGNFENLLIATAKSPAMLMYLDNFSSSGSNSRQTKPKKAAVQDSRLRKQAKPAKRLKGLNENYAREVMELHTLGVDGGYTQADVTEAARILTGWTIYPMQDDAGGARVKTMLDQTAANKQKAKGFVRDGDFLFIPGRHDDGAKTVLGQRYKTGGGYEEGVHLLKMLAHHQSTASFICRKIAVRFVNDNPSKSLVDKMTRTFKEKDGEIKQVLITMVTSPEFWDEAAVREKTKSPFELAIGAVRSLQAVVNQPFQLFNWIDRMGQKMYYYQAPTGFPDKAQYWINTGSLLNRMNFGLALATGRIPGITFDLLALNNNHEPESAEDALRTYSQLMMPERNVEETIKRVVPLLNDPNLSKKVNKAAGDTDMTQKENEEMDDITPLADKENIEETGLALQDSKISGYKLSQVIGIIIGSPEFQRR